MLKPILRRSPTTNQSANPSGSCVPEPGTSATRDFLPEHSFGTLGVTLSCMPRRRMREQIFSQGASQKQPQYTPRNNMADITEENMQDTIMTILKNIEQSLLNVEESTNKMCSLTRSQGELDLECPISENDRIEGVMNEANTMKKQVLPKQ